MTGACRGPNLGRRPPRKARIVLDISAQVTALADRVAALRARRPRVLVALAGAPGSGKSTLAAELARRLRGSGTRAEVVYMPTRRALEGAGRSDLVRDVLAAGGFLEVALAVGMRSRRRPIGE